MKTVGRASRGPSTENTPTEECDLNDSRSRHGIKSLRGLFGADASSKNGRATIDDSFGWRSTRKKHSPNWTMTQTANSLQVLKRIGGDDGTRTRGLCRDRDLRVRNYLKAKSTDGSLRPLKQPRKRLSNP